MTALEKAIADIVAIQVAEAEKRIKESLLVASDRTLSFTEACDYIHMSSYTLRNLCKAKKIPHRTVGAEDSKSPRYLFSSNSLDRWMKEEELKNYRTEDGESQ